MKENFRAQRNFSQKSKKQEDEIRDEFFATEEVENAVSVSTNPVSKAITYSQSQITSFFEKSKKKNKQLISFICCRLNKKIFSPEKVP